MIQKMRRNQNGQSLVEFALILPLLLLIVMGILEFGLIFNAYLTINNASREGARLACVGGSESDVVLRVNDVTPHLSLDEDYIDVLPDGESVTVRIRYDYQLITPIISKLLGGGIPLRSETTMRVE